MSETVFFFQKKSFKVMYDLEMKKKDRQHFETKN